MRFAEGVSGEGRWYGRQKHGMISERPPLADFWRMQWMGPDVWDIIFRLERDLRMKVPRVVIEEAFRASKSVEFRQFASLVVGALHGQKPVGSARPGTGARTTATGRASS